MKSWLALIRAHAKVISERLRTAPQRSQGCTRGRWIRPVMNLAASRSTRPEDEIIPFLRLVGKPEPPQPKSSRCGIGEGTGGILPRMALSENAKDFWGAAAAAAPVIALAGLVSLPDAAVAGGVLKRADRALVDRLTSGVQLLGPPNGWVIIYGISNLVAQGFVLIVALTALLYDGTPIPGVAIIIVEGLGLLALLAAALLAGQVGTARQRLEEEQQQPKETQMDIIQQLAEAIAAKLRPPEAEPARNTGTGSH
jgi:hypothetical protein